MSSQIHVNVRALIERRTNGETQLFIQERRKTSTPEALPEGEDRFVLELPGGRIEPFESFEAALRREVLEETGLTISGIAGLAGRIETHGAASSVECLAPFAVYQTLQGPVDSFGVYFRCRVEGEALAAGDETANGRWMPLITLAEWLRRDPERFSFVDRAGLLYYLHFCTFSKDEAGLFHPPPTARQARALGNLHQARERLYAAIAGLDETARATAPVYADWTVKDILAHLAAWNAEFRAAAAAILGAKPPDASHAISGAADFNEWNLQQRAATQAWSWEQALAAVESELCATADLVWQLTGADWRKRGITPWNEAAALSETTAENDTESAAVVVSYSWRHVNQHLQLIEQWRKGEKP